MIEVTFLGTGTSQGVPMIGCSCAVCQSNDWRDHRLRSSIMVESGAGRVVVDTGPDFRYQMLREKVMRLDGVLYTHEHKDHTGGMDDLRAFNYIQNEPAEVYCSERTARVLKKDFDYAFASNPYPGVPRINIHIIGHDSFHIQDLAITPIELLHFKLPILGYLFGLHRELCYITDANWISDQAIEQIKGCKVLIINALRLEEHISHFSLPQALEVIERVAPERAYLTHASHQLGLYEDVVKLLPENVTLAYDQLKINC
ncbi:MAG: MBL fold metallo-hydrolase [Mucinivorans sp.]